MSRQANWAKAALVGALGSVIMFILMVGGIKSGVAPFNLPPSAAFLERIGLNVGPLALLVHMGYGAFWSIVLVEVFRDAISVGKGILLAFALWLFMMIVYSPIIGWGFFGFGRASQLDPSNPLHLAPGPKYLVATLVLHLIYGTVIGWLDPLWIKFPPKTA